MKFGKLRVKDYGPIKKAQLDLDQVGITHIRALNKDAQDNNGEDTNGAGKSVFFGAIPELHWGKSPTGKDKNTQPSMLSIEYKDVGENKDTFEVRKKYGKNKGFKILCNGEDINIRTMALSEERAKQLLGMSEEEFYTRVYIDSLVPHPLIVGTAAARQDFFVNMFNLHSADNMRKILLADYRQAQQDRAAYLEVRSVFEEMHGKALSQEDLQKRETELQALAEQQETVLKKFRKTQAVRDLLMFEKDNKVLIKKVRKVVGGGGFDYVLEAVQTEIKILKKLQADAKEWDAYDRDLQRYSEKSEPIYKKLRKLMGDNWVFQAEEVKEGSRKARKWQSKVESLQDQLKRLDVGDRPAKQDEPKHTYEECVAKVSQLKQELEHAAQFHKGKCPTCGSSVEARPVGEVREALEKWTARRATAKRYEDGRRGLETWRAAKDAATSLRNELDEAEARASKFARWSDAQELVSRLPEEPTAPEVKRPKIDGVEDQLENMRSKLEILKAAEPIVGKIHELDQLTPAQRERASAFDELGDQMTEINNRVSSLTAEVNSAKEAHNQLELLASRGKTLKRKAADAPVLKALIDFHSTKGLKKLMIERRAKMLQDQINKFRKLFFVEDFRFEFKYSTKLEFLVHRHVGKYVKTTDVRKLSGAEKRMFTILLVVACITLLPKNKRSNVLVLDEPEANLGPARLAKFVRALPILNKIVPHIIVVSPRTDISIPGAKVFTMVKHQGVSTLKAGAAV